MKIGTTPTHIFTLPFDTSLIRTVQVTYSQNGAIVLKKQTEDCTMDGNVVSFTLTQEDTFKFDSSSVVYIQVRALTTDGEALASDVMYTGAGACLDREVLT